MKLIQFITIAALFGFSLALQAQDTIYVSKDNKWVKKAKKAVDILNGRQFDAHYAENVEEARKLVETMLPDGAQIA